MGLFIRRSRVVLGLLLIAGLSVMVSASSLSGNFPVNVIPFPEDATITDQSDYDNDLQVSVDKTMTGQAMVKFYHDSLSKTIHNLKESPGKNEHTYWFWGEFNNGNACFCVTVVNADNTYPNIGTAVQIRVLLKKKNELPEHWRLTKDLFYNFVHAGTN